METVARFLMIALWALRKVQPRAESPHFVCYLIVVQQVIERVVSALLHDPVEVVHRHAAVATLVSVIKHALCARRSQGVYR